MKIPLQAGNFIYFGKQNKEIQLTKKSTDLVRDEYGAVSGSVPSLFIFYCNLFEVVVGREGIIHPQVASQPTVINLQPHAGL